MSYENMYDVCMMYDVSLMHLMIDTANRVDRLIYICLLFQINAKSN